MPDAQQPFSPFARQPPAAASSAVNAAGDTGGRARPGSQPLSGPIHASAQSSAPSPFKSLPRPPFSNPLSRQPSAGSKPASGLKPSLGGGLGRPPLRTPPTFTPPPLPKPFVPPQPRASALAPGPSSTPRLLHNPHAAGQAGPPNGPFAQSGAAVGPSASGSYSNPPAADKAGHFHAQSAGSGPATGTLKTGPASFKPGLPSASKPAAQLGPPGGSFAAPKPATALTKPTPEFSSVDGGNDDEDFFGSIASPQASTTTGHPFTGGTALPVAVQEPCSELERDYT